MPQTIQHSAQEMFALYGQLSDDEQNAIASLIEIFLRQKQFVPNKKNKNIMDLAGCLKNKTNIKLTDDELEQAVHCSYYARDKK